MPATGGHGATVIPSEGYRHLAGDNQYLCACVLAVAILVQPVGPVIALIEAGKAPLLLASFLLSLALLTVQGQAGFAVAMIRAAGPVAVASLFVQASGVAMDKVGNND